MVRPSWAFAALTTLFALDATAEVGPALPDASPRARTEQRVGLTSVWIDYGSPAAKGRKIWGGLVPYDEMWRTGANASTRLHFSRDARFGGVEVPAGTYGLFTVPGDDQWTVVLNTKSDAWGTNGYDAANDAARVEVEPETAPARERLTFLFSDTTEDSTRLDLEWAGLRVSVPIRVATDAHVRAEIAEATANTWKPWERSARYLLDRGEDLDRALSYVEQSIALEANWRNLWVKARILGARGKEKAAIDAARRAKRIGDDSGAFRFYAPRMDEAIARWKGKS